MYKKLSLMLTLLSMLIVPAGIAQDNGNPTIAILRYGALFEVELNAVEGGILDVLQSYGFISVEEYDIVHQRQNLEGENVNIIWGEAGYDIPTANLMVEDVLDGDADVLVALTTLIAQIVVNATADMDDPPTVLFTSVYNPYAAGIAEAPCIKPSHVTGSEFLVDYDYVLSMLMLQDPDMKVIGTIYNSSETTGVVSAERITAFAEELGLTVEHATVTGLADLRPAAEGLVNKGVEAIVLSSDSTTASGLPIIATIGNENGIPIFHPSVGAIYYGATVGAGFYLYYDQGINVGLMLTAHLNGDIDIATTAINEQGNLIVGVNLDSASLQGIEISAELLEQVDVMIEGGKFSSSPIVRRLLERTGVIVPMEDRAESDKAFLDALHCTPEMIAEQQAELDAMSEE